MLSSTILCDDTNYLVDLMKVPPRSVVQLVKEGVQRWQANKIVQHHQDVCFGGERIWMRVLRRCLGGTKAGADLQVL